MNSLFNQKPIQFLLILLVTGLFATFSYMSNVSASLTSTLTQAAQLFVVLILVWIFTGGKK